MTKLIPAIYEHGSLKLIKDIPLAEHQRVFIAITISDDDVPSLLISKFAEKSESFKFLNSPEEDIYSPADGQEV